MGSYLNYPEMTWAVRGKGELRLERETCFPAFKITSWKSLWHYVLRQSQSSVSVIQIPKLALVCPLFPQAVSAAIPAAGSSPAEARSNRQELLTRVFSSPLRWSSLMRCLDHDTKVNINHCSFWVFWFIFCCWFWYCFVIVGFLCVCVFGFCWVFLSL